MAYFMFRTQVISKTKQSAVAAAAYRSGESLKSERDGLTKNYVKRDVKPDTFILKPEHAPEWVLDREKLWNEVENIEKQHNAQLAREFVVSLPTFLPENKQKELIKEYCDETLVNNGMIADVAIHRDKSHNPHAHIMLTMRPFNEDGTWGKKRKKIDGKSVHLTDWNKKETMIEWRKSFADKTNEKFIELGIEDRVSHESYAKQGIDKIPQIRLSRDAYQLENREKEISLKQNKEYEPRTYYGKLNKEINEINKELEKYQNENVVSIEQQKNDKQDKKDFESIRKNVSLSSSEKSALQMVAKRAKTYVDYSIAKNVYSDIKDGNWKKQIDSKWLEIQAEKNLINKIHTSYKDKPNNVSYYGINPKDYSPIMKDKIAHFKENESKYNELIAKYDRVLKKSELAYEIQKNIVQKEFAYLYPNKDNFTNDEKYIAINYFRENDTVLPENLIKEFAKGKEIVSNKPTLVQQTNNISKSLFVLDRAINKHQKERFELLRNREFDKVYELDRKIEQYELRRKDLNKEIQGNISYLQARLSSNYKDKTIEKVSHPEVLVRLYTLNQTGKSSGNLSKDLSILSKTMDKEFKEFSSNRGKEEKQVDKSYTNHVSDGLIQSIDNVRRASEQNKAYDLDRTKKRRRGKHEKNHENEL